MPANRSICPHQIDYLRRTSGQLDHLQSYSPQLTTQAPNPTSSKPPRRPWWYDPARTPHLAHHLPIRSPDADSMVTLHPSASVGWLKCRIADQATSALRVTEFPATMTKDQYIAIGRKQRSAKRPKLSHRCSKTKGVPRRVFSLRLAPTKEQKLYFQRAFGIACLAKRLAYKHLGDQSVPMTTERMQELRTRICTEHLTTRVHREAVLEGEKRPTKGFKNVTRLNEFLPLKSRERLFETVLHRHDEKAREFYGRRLRRDKHRFRAKWTTPIHRRLIPYDVRFEAVTQFCQAVQATQSKIAEQQRVWDDKMAAHQRWLRQEQAVADEEALVELTGERIAKRRARKRALDAIAEREKKQPVSKHPPRGERPEMRVRQVKPTDRNSPVQTIRINTTTSSRTIIHAASWFENDDVVRLRSGLTIALWGSPSRRRRELRRLSARMHEGERATRQQITIKYDHGRYYLQVQCLLSPDLPLRTMSTTEPVRAVALDPGVRTFFGTYDSSGRFGDIGDGQIERIIRVAKKADRIQSHIATDLQGPKNKAKRRKARRRLRQRNAKCRDLKNDAHWKAARALCESYDHVMIPKFHCAAMKRFLAKSSTRQLVHWSHYQFRQRLKHKAEELGVRVSECREPLTTMTCTACLWVEESFRKNPAKVFECKKCGFKIDRDYNASRNCFFLNGERCVGRLEPMPTPPTTPKAPVGNVPISSQSDDDDNDEFSGWMWSRRKKNNTATG
ncbi:Transposase [Medusavirus stheno T3]|uniref:Transposase n=1 Tax=Medusavirus stheno T3 TaxID=3069717 RepID=A0A7S8BDM9_9VIRU|nr:Transposase [Acanthamoeba castellanii medusavirus]QPB44359.1 Transposase [Medusavirus stheno T3]